MLNNCKTILALLARDIKVIQKNFSNELINTLVLVLFYEFIFGYIGPLIGITEQASFNIFVGNLGVMILFLSYGRAFTDLFDLHKTGFFSYKCTLPIKFNWLLFSYILSYIVNYFIILIPLFIIGKLALGSKLPLEMIDWPLFLGIVFSATLFTATFYLNLVFRVSTYFFTHDYWQRIHGPFFLLGCSFFTYKPAAVYSPALSLILLLNPFTYINEGMRSALSNSDNYLSATVCLTVLCILSTINLILLFGFSKKKLDII